MRRVVSATLVVLVVVAAGCASKKSGTDATRTATSIGGATGANATTTTHATSGKGGDYCDLARSVVTQLKGKFLFDPTNTNLKDEAGGLNDTLASMAELAAAEIKADSAAVMSAFKLYSDEMKKVDYDFSKINRSKLTELESPTLEAASKRIDKYNERECGIKI